MGYALLWIESLIVSLLLVATLTACAARLRRRWLRVVLSLLVPPVLVLFYAAATAYAAALYSRGLLGGGTYNPFEITRPAVYRFAQWIYPMLLPGGMLVLTSLFLVGSMWLLVRGLRRGQGEAANAAAASWPRGKLGIALAAAAALHLMTFWNMDVAARQQLAAIRAEAGALALSVAPLRLPDRDNAALIYQQAFEAMGNNECAPGSWQWEQPWSKTWNAHWAKWNDSRKIDFDWHDQQLRRFLAREAPALKLLRQAAAMPGCNFDRDYGRPDPGMLLPEVGALRTAARLLALDAICASADGDYHRARWDISSIFCIARHIGSEPLVVSMLVATVLDRLAVDTLQAVLANCPNPAEDLAQVAIPDASSLRAMLKRALHYEEAFRLAIFEKAAAGEYGMGLIGALCDGGNQGIYHCGPPAAVYRIFLLGDDLEAQRQFAVELDRAAGRPYWQAKGRLQSCERTLCSQPGGLLTRMLMPAVSMVVNNMAEVEAYLDTARGLAAVAYRGRNGRLPAKLDDLVPEFLNSPPLDPFDGKPLKLRRTEQGLIVYSIGPDLIDNGGAPLDKNERTGDIIFAIAEPAAKK